MWNTPHAYSPNPILNSDLPNWKTENLRLLKLSRNKTQYLKGVQMKMMLTVKKERIISKT